MCGIFGIINNRPKHFDYQTFCTLGVVNDERGGDSCGIFIDGDVEYGVDKLKFFSDFMKTSDLLENTKTSKIAIGHCRKASVGAIGAGTAQPVVIYEDNKPVFVVIHNGTIYNYEALAKRYIPEENIVGLTDSQVMTRIFYKKGYDVLGEYNGGSAFVIVDYRKEEPEVFMFKGESLYNNVLMEERPLYLIMNKDNVVFSSIGKYLLCKKTKSQLYTLMPNKLIKIDENSQLQVIKEYDRTEKHQNRVYYPAYYGYDDDYDYYYGVGKYKSKYYDKAEKKKDHIIQLPAKIQKNSNNNNRLILRFIKSNNDGTYMIDGVLAQGFYYIDNNGKICTSDEVKKINNNLYRMFFFWQGVMLYNKECYKFLKKMAKVYNLTEGELIEDYPLLVHYLSPDPFKDDQTFNDGAMYDTKELDSFELFTNQQWQYFMSNDCFWLDEEGLISANWSSDYIGKKATFDDYCKMCDSANIDFSLLIDNYKIY